MKCSSRHWHPEAVLLYNLAFLTVRGPVHELTPQNCCHPLDKKLLFQLTLADPVSKRNVGDKSIVENYLINHKSETGQLKNKNIVFWRI